MAKRKLSKKRVQYNRHEALEHERRAWTLRSRGYSQTKIAEALGLTQAAVSKILGRVEKRELKRLSGSVERLKVTQHAQLEHVIEEAIDAWHRSKTTRKRVSVRSGSGDGNGVQTQEAVERDGDCSYLYAAMNAQSHVRQLWGLDVAPALQEPAISIAELARGVLTRAAEYEQREAADNQARDTGDPGDTGQARVSEMPEGSSPVQ